MSWEGFAVSLNGTSVVYGDIRFSAGGYMNLGAAVTTAPTTGLTKGDLVMIFSTSSPYLGVCTSTAANTLKYISPFDTKTGGRASV